jgi:hypothetical protein
MARNQRGGYLDKPTRHHLSALDAFIQQQAEANKPRQPDEFTAKEYADKMKLAGVKLSSNTAINHLQALIDEGKLTKRSMVITNSKTNLYRFL